jgi:hypothetical protein
MKRYLKNTTLTYILLLVFLGVFVQITIADEIERALGDIPLDEETYQKYLKTVPSVDALPVSYDARDDGIVTSPKDQGACGSCWAFACVGAFESHLLKEYGLGPYDLSEQQQVSCNLLMSGCCGGSSSALTYWQTQGPIWESCFPYGEYNTGCPTQRTVPCGDSSGCQELPYWVTGYHTVSSIYSQMKNSCYSEGPSYCVLMFIAISTLFGAGVIQAMYMLMGLVPADGEDTLS